MYSSTTRGSVRPALAGSIQKTLFNTFVTVGGMTALTGVAAFACLGLKLGLGMTLGLFVASLVVLFATLAFRNSGFGLVLLGLFSALQGVTLGPVLNRYLHLSNGTGIVATAAGLTALATFACAAYAITSRRDFSQWFGFLFAGLIVVVVASLVALFIPIPGLHLTIAAVSALLFLGWLLYDVGAIVQGQETNYIVASLNIYLDVLNLFLNLLQLFGALGSDD